MATNYPTALDDGTSLPNPAAGDAPNSPSHSAQHSTENDAIKAIEAKLGTGASTPVNNRIMYGTGTGTSAWTQLTSAQLAASLTDETGTGANVFATSPTLVTPQVDTINESTPANGVTVDGLNIKDSALNTNNSVVTANITDSAVTYAKVAAGFPVQIVDTTSSAVSTGTTIIPMDDTVPQNTEGVEVMTLAITPKATTHKLVIDINVYGGSSVADDLIIALFQDSTANALAATATPIGAGGSGHLNLTHELAAGTTSATTFKVRFGGSQAGTRTFNGRGGGRHFGAITKSSIVITEYKA